MTEDVFDLGFDSLLNRDTANNYTPETNSPDASSKNGYNGGLFDPVNGQVDADEIGTGTMVAHIEQAGGRLFYAKKTFSDTTNGYILGIDETDENKIKFHIGNSTSSLDWNVTTANTLTVKGNITATTGTIGGFEIGSDYIRDVANSFGLASTVTGGDDIRIWAGATYANRATAPFRVSEAGDVVANDITATGTINATGGYLGAANTALPIDSTGIDVGTTGRISGGATAYDTGTGFWLGYTAGAYKFFIGTAAGNKLTWSGSALEVTGAITATSGSITGAFTVGGSLNISTSGNIKSGQTAYHTGSGYFLEYNGGTPRLSIGDGTLNNSLTWDGTTLLVNGLSLQSEDRFGNGSDGAVTISVNTSLSRDMFYTDLTVNNGVTLNTAGYRIFGTGVLSNNGTISNVGSNGSDGSKGTSGGAGGGGGGAAGGAASTGSVPTSAASGAGGNGSTSPGGAGSNGTAGTSATKAIGVAGSTGGTGGSAISGGAGGGGGSGGALTTTANNVPRNYTSAYILIDNTTTPTAILVSAGSGGGGGGGRGNNGSGDGGSGGGGGGAGGAGGIVSIFFKTISNAGTISAAGGNGGIGGNGGNGLPTPASTARGGGGGGGGAGGSGGVVILLYGSYFNSGTVSAAAGTGGAGGTGGLDSVGAGGVRANSGTSGTAGSAGRVIEIPV